MRDGYEAWLPEDEAAALALTDALINDPSRLGDDAKAALRKHFSEAEIVELGLGIGLFLSMSKVLITLGLEPESMETTVLPTPGSST